MTASHQATVDHPPESRRPTAEAATPVYPAAAAEMRAGGAYAHSTLALHRRGADKPPPGV
jgi:hypothetical protein